MAVTDFLELWYCDVNMCVWCCVWAGCTYIVVLGWPLRVLQEVLLFLYFCLIVIFALLLLRQRLPLWTDDDTQSVSTHTYLKLPWRCKERSKHTYLLSQDFVDHRTVSDVILCHNIKPLLPPIEHKGVGRLLDVGLILFLVLGDNRHVYDMRT